MELLDFLVSNRDALASLAEPLKVLTQPRAPRVPWKPSIDIVIPHHRGLFTPGQPTPGLSLTVMSIEAELRDSGLDYRYFVVNNGNPQTGDERDCLNLFLEYLDTTGHVGKVFEIPEAMSPPNARNLGAAAGSAELLFFFDDHISLGPGFFGNILSTFEVTGCAAVFPRMYGLVEHPEKRVYHHRLTLDKNFWGVPSFDAYAPSAYRVASANHGAFGIRRSAWNEVGGYWDGFVGWGGEEAELNLKLNLLDKAVYLDPRAEHWHHFSPPGKYTYSRPPEQTFTNYFCAANIIGGQRWAQKVADSIQSRFVKGAVNKAPTETLAQIPRYMEGLLAEAVARSATQAKWMAAHRKRTLDEQLALFQREGVAH